PPSEPSAADAVALRPATFADIPQIMELYARRSADSIVWNCVSEQYWRYLIDVWGDPAAPNDPVKIGVAERLHMIVDPGGKVCGLVLAAAKRWESDLRVYAADLAPEASAVSGRSGALARATLPWRAVAQRCGQPAAAARDQLLLGARASAERRVGPVA